MAGNGSEYSWVEKRREWWRLHAGTQRVAKLRRALSLCGSDSRCLMAYDIVHESVADGPKGYVVVGRDWLPMLHANVVQHMTSAQCTLSYDGLYEVVSGTNCTALYLDIEVGCLKAGDCGLLSVDQLKLVSADAEFWWSDFFTWYLSVAALPWTVEEYECAQSVIVSYIRDFLVESEGWHKGLNTGPEGPVFKAPRDTKLVVLKCHRADGSKFSLHVVCPALLFDCSTLGMKSFVTDLAVYVVYRLFKEINSYRGSMLDLSVDLLTPRDRAVLRLMKLHKYSVDSVSPSIGKVSPIDLCVYKVQGQLFRMVGMGKVTRGTLGEPLVICAGDGSSSRKVETNHGVGSRYTWLDSLVCMHRREGVRFFDEPCSWHSWFYLSQDVEW